MFLHSVRSSEVARLPQLLDVPACLDLTSFSCLCFFHIVSAFYDCCFCEALFDICSKEVLQYINTDDLLNYSNQR